VIVAQLSAREHPCARIQSSERKQKSACHWAGA